MKKASICFVMVLATVCCCKEPIDQTAPFVGTWNFKNVDSVLYIQSTGWVYLEKEIETSGAFVFNPDGRGTINCDSPRITDFESDFSWFYDSINKVIDFNFSNGTTIGLISHQSDSVMTMYFRCYLGFPDWTTRFYLLTLTK